MIDATRYPLAWPTGWKRSTRGGQLNGRFSSRGHWITVSAALDRVEAELGRLGVASWNIIISTNLRLGARGNPLSGQPEPDDRGVAVYFKMGEKPRVLACDRYTKVADNLAAIAAHVDALRRIDRYGVGTLDQAFAGYDALPPPGATNRPPWRKVLGIAEGASGIITPETVNAAYRELAKAAHPDLQGGSHEAMAMLNAARDEALEELGA